MLDKLRNYFLTRTPVVQFADSVLGSLEYDSDTEAWSKTIGMNGKSIRLIVDGDWGGPKIEEIVPAEHLVMWARQISENPEEFCQTLFDFVQRDTEVNSSNAEYREEIGDLRIDTIYLGPYTKQGDAIVNLAGGKDGRHWRCDYRDKKPKSLGYDS